MNKKRITFIFFVTLLIAAYFSLPEFVQSKAEKQLASSFNYKNPIIGSTDISLNKITFKNITLKRGHSIKEITITNSPLYFLGISDLKKVIINGLNFNEKANNLLSFFRGQKDISTGKELPASIITIENSFIHIPIPSNDLKIKISGDLTKEPENKKTSINIKLSSDNINNNFDALVSGTSDGKNKTSINVSINSLNIIHKAAKIHRATGWLSLENSKNSEPSISGEIDAGSGSIANIPTKNISIVIGKQRSKYDIILRAQASGVDGVALLSDVSYGQNNDDIKMQTSLNIKDSKEFTNYLNSLGTTKTPYFEGIKEANISINYLPERKFADGPFPFNINATSKNENILKGTFLIYPKEMEIRGNAQTNASYTNNIKQLFSIKDEKMSGENIRLDGSIKNLF